MKAILSELHNTKDEVSVKTKQTLLSTMSTADHNGNITNTNNIKCMHPKIQDQINDVNHQQL